jgi:hypothetical protein
MITDGLTKVNNSEVCVNDDGFGYASEGEWSVILGCRGFDLFLCGGGGRQR